MDFGRTLVRVRKSHEVTMVTSAGSASAKRNLGSRVSIMNLRDFLADNMAKEFVGVVAQSLDDKYLRYNH